MLNTLHLLRVLKTIFISTFIRSTFIMLLVISAVFCASLEEDVQWQQAYSMGVMRFGDCPAIKNRPTRRHAVIQSFKITGFVVGTCKAASHERNTVNLTVGDQIFSKTFDPFRSNDEKEITLISTADSSNTITIVHNFHSSFNAFKLTDALRDNFGRLEFLLENDDNCRYIYIGDILRSASTDLSSIILPVSISAAFGTSPNIYGICVTCDSETNKVVYTLTDGKTVLSQIFDRKREVTADDDVKRSIDFGNGISLIASIYGENAYLLSKPPLAYELFEILQ